MSGAPEELTARRLREDMLIERSNGKACSTAGITFLPSISASRDTESCSGSDVHSITTVVNQF